MFTAPLLAASRDLAIGVSNCPSSESRWKIRRDSGLKAGNAQRKAEADEARRARMAAAEARLAMKGVR